MSCTSIAPDIRTTIFIQPYFRCEWRSSDRRIKLTAASAPTASTATPNQRGHAAAGFRCASTAQSQDSAGPLSSVAPRPSRHSCRAPAKALRLLRRARRAARPSAAKTKNAFFNTHTRKQARNCQPRRSLLDVRLINERKWVSETPRGNNGVGGARTRVPPRFVLAGGRIANQFPLQLFFHVQQYASVSSRAD